MARLNNHDLGEITKKTMKEFHKPLLVVVDMVNGFIFEGALHDEAIADTIVPMTTVLKKDIDNVFFVDCHEEDAGEFSSYPIHCIRGTTESEIVSALKPYAKVVIEKNSTNGFVSAGWQQFMIEKLADYQDIIVVGCCTDICVLQFALGLRTWLNDQNWKKQRVMIPVDMVDTYHIDGVHDGYACNAFALQNMLMNGIELINIVEEG